MSAADVAAHQAKHGFAPNIAPSAVSAPIGSKLPKPVQMTIPEKEMELMLRVQLQEGKIREYRFQGIKLAWGVDPKTGKVMIYTPDFYVVRAAFRQNPYISDILCIETKGSELHQSAITRFKGCRACWPMFSFELHQRDKDGGWRHVL